MQVKDDILYLSEEDINTIISAVEDRLSGITLDDIEVECDESSYSVGDEELEVEAVEGLMAYVDWTAEYWYREWTETWYDPYCTPSFSDGDIDDVWFDGISLEHDEYEIDNVEEIEARIYDVIHGCQMEKYKARKAREKAARERRLAAEKARREAAKKVS